jgi:Fe-S cluster assembly scaffold protein SufB
MELESKESLLIYHFINPVAAQVPSAKEAMAEMDATTDAGDPVMLDASSSLDPYSFALLQPPAEVVDEPNHDACPADLPAMSSSTMLLAGSVSVRYIPPLYGDDRYITPLNDDDCYVVPGFHGFIPPIFRAEQAKGEKVPVDAPTKCSTSLLNCDAYDVHNTATREAANRTPVTDDITNSNASPSMCPTMVPNRDATPSVLTMVAATWSDEYALVDLQSVCYYSTSNAKPKLNSLDEVDPKLLKTFIPLTGQKHLSDVAIDAVIDSASITITHHEALMAKGVIFCSIPKSICEYPDLVRHYLGSIVLPGDNYYAALNSAVFSDGSFCFVPKDTVCPMEISTYFRINNKETNQFERTLIVADERCTYVLLIELCLQVDGVKVRLPPWPPPVWTFWLPYDVCSGMHYNCRDCAWFKGIWQPLFLVTPFYIRQLKLGWDVFLGKEIGEPQGLKWLAVSSGNMAEKMQKGGKYDYASEFLEFAAEFSSSDNSEDGATLLMYKHYAATAISKGIHCLSLRLTDEYSSNAHARMSSVFCVLATLIFFATLSREIHGMFSFSDPLMVVLFLMFPRLLRKLQEQELSMASENLMVMVFYGFLALESTLSTAWGQAVF